MKGVTTMKYLKIDKSKGYYLDKNENYEYNGWASPSNTV